PSKRPRPYEGFALPPRGPERRGRGSAARQAVAALEVERVAADRDHPGHRLLERGREGARLASDRDPPPRRNEVGRRIALDLLRGDRVELLDPRLQLADRTLRDDERADRRGKPGGGLDAAREAADQRGLAGSELVVTDRLVHQAVDLFLHEPHDLRGRFVLGLHADAEERRFAARLEAAARAVAEAALDADLLVDARRVAAAEHRVEHRADRALAAGPLGQRERDDDR